MPTSTKVRFRLEDLQTQALASVDERISMAAERLSQMTSEEAYREALSGWRARQESRLSDLFRELDTCDNHRLAAFKIEPMPNLERYAEQKAERELDRLRSLRSKIVAKAAAIVPDADGNVALTKTQMEDFFGL